MHYVEFRRIYKQIWNIVFIEKCHNKVFTKVSVHVQPWLSRQILHLTAITRFFMHAWKGRGEWRRIQLVAACKPDAKCQYILHSLPFWFWSFKCVTTRPGAGLPARWTLATRGRHEQPACLMTLNQSDLSVALLKGSLPDTWCSVFRLLYEGKTELAMVILITRAILWVAWLCDG